VEVVKDGLVKLTIDRLARYVAQQGHLFEQVIMEREKENERYKFLFEEDSLEKRYYRWRVFAFSQGDTMKSWREKRFRIYEKGPWWYPPKVPEKPKKRKAGWDAVGMRTAVLPAANLNPLMAANAVQIALAAAGNLGPHGTAVGQSPGAQGELTAQAEAHAMAQAQARAAMPAAVSMEKMRRPARGKYDPKQTGGLPISEYERDLLEEHLRNLNSSRGSIRAAMIFCLDHADSALEIADVVVESLMLDETFMLTKISRLLLLSDILHNTNSARKAAWAYRSAFEKELPAIFEHFSHAHQKVQSKLASQKAKDKVLAVLRAWEQWAIFVPQFLRGLEASYLSPLSEVPDLDNLDSLPSAVRTRLQEWKNSHFSILERQCRMRGLKSLTSHLTAEGGRSLMQVRQEWLLKRLLNYDLYWHQKHREKGSKMPFPGSSLDGSALDGDAFDPLVPNGLSPGEDVDGEDLDSEEIAEHERQEAEGSQDSEEEEEPKAPTGSWQEVEMPGSVVTIPAQPAGDRPPLLTEYALSDESDEDAPKRSKEEELEGLSQEEQLDRLWEMQQKSLREAAKQSV